MKAVLENPYKGINAHLHSFAQNPMGSSPSIWTSFHASHIAELVNALNRRLPLNYIARPEQSLQIWTGSVDEINPKPRSPRPDVSIYRSQSGEAFQAANLGDNAPVLVIALEKYLEEEITIPSVAIYKVADHELIGKPVTRIELLSASNKIGGSGLDGYRKNRLAAILSGTSLIELDYLHESNSPLYGIPRYPDEANAQPYYIAVTDCRAGYPKEMLAYIRAVNQALPSELEIPLADNDSVTVDFEAAYQDTFRLGRWGIQLDYSQLPRNFDTYSKIDQASIQSVMQLVKEG